MSIHTSNERDAKPLPPETCEVRVTLLTGGGDKPYAYGIAKELISKGAVLDFIGSDELDFPEFRGDHRVNFFNLRGDQRASVGVGRKIARICTYYIKLFSYAATAKPKLFHLLWNNKFEYFDRTLLMVYYKLLGKKTVLTLHNVNTRKRDNNDSYLNRLTLRIQYQLADHIFVHTEKMKSEATQGFGIPSSKITVIPFGINNAVPNTPLTCPEARQWLGIPSEARTLLFFGNITPYKGLEYLLEAFERLSQQEPDLRLLIAGRPKGSEEYWQALQVKFKAVMQPDRVLIRSDYIPDEEVQYYFQAADVLVLPYRHVYQSGVMFLGYSFGLPALAADVGSLKDEIVEGETGFVFKTEDSFDLEKTIQRYFSSSLYANLDQRREKIKAGAAAAHSWDEVGMATLRLYSALLELPSTDGHSNTAAHQSPTHREVSSSSNQIHS